MLSAGEQKRVIENPAVHPDGAANLNFRDGESNGDHAVLSIFTGIMRLQGETEKSLLKTGGIACKRDIAGDDLAAPVFHPGADSRRIVLYRVASDKKCENSSPGLPPDQSTGTSAY